MRAIAEPLGDVSCMGAIQIYITLPYYLIRELKAEADFHRPYALLYTHDKVP